MEQPASDAELVERSIEEPVAFEPIFERHFAAIHTYLHRRGGRDLADDLAAETFALAFNPGHRWYYAPRMQRDEIFLFKCFDSAPNGGPPFTAHTAFDDPNTPADAWPRESIETRTFAFFD